MLSYATDVRLTPLAAFAAFAVARRRSPPGVAQTLLCAQAAQLGAAFDALVRPMSVCGSPAPGLPALAALPLAAQANLLLLLRAAPHRFTSSQHAAVVASVAQLAAIGASGAGLLQLLACDVSREAIHAAVPPCPDFLFTPEPCLLWAPVLADDQAATALQGQLAAARGQQCQDGTEGEDAVGSAKRHAEGQAVPGGSSKRPRQAAACADPLTDQSAADAELAAAVQAVRHALAAHASGGGGELRCIPAELQAALGTLALRAAAGTAAGAAALQASGLASLEDDSLLLLLLQELVSPTSSYARCSVAAGAVLLPRLQGLLGAAPRDLAAAVEHVGKCALCPVCRVQCVRACAVHALCVLVLCKYFDGRPASRLKQQVPVFAAAPAHVRC